jgi:hypothetical protein
LLEGFMEALDFGGETRLVLFGQDVATQRHVLAPDGSHGSCAERDA